MQAQEKGRKPARRGGCDTEEGPGEGKWGEEERAKEVLSSVKEEGAREVMLGGRASSGPGGGAEDGVRC